MPGQVPKPKSYRELAPRLSDGPIDLRELIDGNGPLELDVGFGRGLSLMARAAAAPESRILGVEVRPKLVSRAADRISRASLARVRVFEADVRELLARSGPGGCLARAFVHFPDPWWKSRHRKRRVVDAALLDLLARLLADGGELFVQTDVRERAIEYRDELRGHAAYALLGTDGFVSENPFSAPSNRERRAITDGLPIWRILARRLRRDGGSTCASL